MAQQGLQCCKHKRRFFSSRPASAALSCTACAVCLALACLTQHLSPWPVCLVAAQQRSDIADGPKWLLIPMNTAACEERVPAHMMLKAHQSVAAPACSRHGDGRQGGQGECERQARRRSGPRRPTAPRRAARPQQQRRSLNRRSRPHSSWRTPAASRPPSASLSRSSRAAAGAQSTPRGRCPASSCSRTSAQVGAPECLPSPDAPMVQGLRPCLGMAFDKPLAMRGCRSRDTIFAAATSNMRVVQCASCCRGLLSEAQVVRHACEYSTEVSCAHHGMMHFHRACTSGH